MAKRYMDVYVDESSLGNSVGVRDDGAAHIIFGRSLDSWRRYQPYIAWTPSDTRMAQTWRGYCGELIGRIEYDDGGPEPRTVVLTLPWPPSVNRIWRAVAGRLILSALARRYHKLAANALPAGKVEPLRGRLAVHVTLHPPVKLGAGKAWDIMNREKCLCDALTKQRVWLDDSQIDDFHAVRGAPAGKGRVEMTIQEVD